MKHLKILGLVLIVLAVIWVVGGWQVAFYYAKITVNVHVTDCNTKESIAGAKVTIYDDIPETYAEGYTNNQGNFFAIVGLYIPEGMSEVEGALKYIQAKAEKQGYGASYTLGKVAVTLPFIGTVMDIELCLPKESQPPSCEGEGVILFEHINYVGRCERFMSDDPDLRDNPIGNDTASSILIRGNYQVTLYEHISYGGKSETFTSSDADLRDNPIGNDTVSSLQMKRKENQPPHASFTYSPSFPKVGEEVRFDGSRSYDSDGSIVSWAWNFGDGYTGTGQMVSHTYRVAGRYTVTLTVRDNEGASDATSQFITVQSPQVLPCPSGAKDMSLPSYDRATLPPHCSQVYRIASLPKGTCIATDLTGVGRSGNVQGYDMSLREGAPPTRSDKDATSWVSSSDPYYSYKEYIRYATSSLSQRDVYIKVDNTGDDAWSYTLELFQCGGPVDLPFRVTDSVRFNADSRIYMIKNPPPNITIVVDLSGAQGADLDLYLREGQMPRSPDGYDDWSRSPGSIEHIEYKTKQQVQDIYIKVQCVAGCDSGRGNFTLEAQSKGPLKASFIYTPRTPEAGQEVTFDASGSQPADRIIQYEWSFGDGSTGTGRIAKHTYQTAGTYTVTLKVTDQSGRSATTSQAVQVQHGRPQASFTWNPLSPKAGEEVTFDASGSQPQERITRYRWDFGDGNTGEGKIVTHKYRTGGDFTVTLVVTDRDGYSTANSQKITVTPSLFLVFLHGWFSNASALTRVVEAVKEMLKAAGYKDREAYRIFTPDLDNKAAHDIWASNIASAITNPENIPEGAKIVLIGHSMGGKAALYAVAANVGGITSRVARIITYNTPYLPLNQFRFNKALAPSGTFLDGCTLFLPSLGIPFITTPALCKSLAEHDSTKDVAVITQAHNIEVYALYQGEREAASPDCDIPQSLPVKWDLYPDHVDDGLVPVDAQRPPNVTGTTVYGAGQVFCHWHYSPEGEGEAATNAQATAIAEKIVFYVQPLLGK